jgi:acetyl esterase/lipase
MPYSRRSFLGSLLPTIVHASEPITRPVVSEEACPLVHTEPVASDGRRGFGLLRKPPGGGRFPAILWIHGGLVTRSLADLEVSIRSPNPSRFLAAGYVVSVPTYRSRDDDPQSTVSLRDCLAHVEHLRRLPSVVDPRSIVVYGCSGGGDLALEIAAAMRVCAIVPEEPASLLLTGVFNARFPKKGERYTPADAAPISEEPKRYYKEEHRKLTRAKLARIECPILIVQGDVHPINRFNSEVLIPELEAAGKRVEVITYPGEPHCFSFQGSRRHTAAWKAFRDVDAFCRRHLATQPRALPAHIVRHEPL